VIGGWWHQQRVPVGGQLAVVRLTVVIAVVPAPAVGSVPAAGARPVRGGDARPSGCTE